MQTIIVGAGLAGLSTADGLLRSGYPGNQIRILEQYRSIGGRVVSGTKDGSTYEIGAGRIHAHHDRVHRLLRRFGLSKKLRSIDAPVFWNDRNTIQPNAFLDTWQAYRSLFQTLPPHVLANSTLHDIALRTLGEHNTHALFDMLSYRSEIELLRADLALESDIFLSSGYTHLEGGLSQLIHRLELHLRSKGVRFQTNTTVSNVSRKGTTYLVKTNQTTEYADRVVLALHVKALRSFAIFRDFTLFDHVQMAPLTRIYAQFPHPWLVPHTVSNSHLRDTIPIDPQKGIVMISYTDGRDTTVWKGLRGRRLQRAIATEMNKVFPDLETAPTWIQSYEWKDGCSYWIPGNYDPVDIRQRVLRPLPDYPELYICNESFSLKQAWMEGALEHAEMLVSLLTSPRTKSVYPAE
jgi:monoamine oxidase